MTAHLQYLAKILVRNVISITRVNLLYVGNIIGQMHFVKISDNLLWISFDWIDRIYFSHTSIC